MTTFNKKFDSIRLKLASPNRILKWGTRELPNNQLIGIVTSPETLNYRTHKIEFDGLFCQRIFGPIKNFECACGKYKQVRYEGLICDRCGVELIEASVRRQRMGCVQLNHALTNTWYINSRPNYIALLLEIEQCEKNFNTAYNEESKICQNLVTKKAAEKLNEKGLSKYRIQRKGRSDQTKADRKKCQGFKVVPATVTDQWDNRIKRIKVASLVYLLPAGEGLVPMYALAWDLIEYRKSREKGKTRYPLREYPPEKLTLEYLRKTVNIKVRSKRKDMLGSELIGYELERLNLGLEIRKTRKFALQCTKVLNKESPEYDESNWFRKWEQERLSKNLRLAVKRIRILENLKNTGSRPEWMIFTFLPIIPPNLRPGIKLESGEIAFSDLNDLYRFVIARNNRIERLRKANCPLKVLISERRLLQESLDRLIDNEKSKEPSLDSNKRPLKSLSETIRGKQGRFRLNLLGKRVDYSGRSVIIVGPTLTLNQCGLPYEMAAELFQPFLIHELIDQGLVPTMRVAINLIQQKDKIIDSVLEKVLKNHPIFLNRAPTLHRLGVQAFEPILVKGRAIQLHPLVCSGFNADFDGDQMAVHIPLSVEAQAECYTLMSATYNFLSPANGEALLIPSQDMVLGCYYLTVNNIKELLGSQHYFANLNDVKLAYRQNKIEIHSIVWVRMEEETSNISSLIKTVTLKDETIIEYYKDKQIRKTKTGERIVQYLKTTPGRVIFHSLIQKTLKIF